MTYAKVIADSISHRGHRLTTIEVRMHRFVLAEFNTHRVFSRNSASSRAIPFAKQVERVLSDPALPVVWASEQKGMQGGDEIEQVAIAVDRWKVARDNAVREADRLARLGVHKSIVNRLLEPFMWHTVIVTATEWEGFWHQRLHHMAQPEIRVAAECMKQVYDESDPVELIPGQWHLPYIQEHEFDDEGIAEDLPAISAARCARVSYLTHDGVCDPQKDLGLFARLVDRTENPDDPIHWSPLEHVATPCNINSLGFASDGGIHKHLGNFKGWDQLRHITGGRNA